MKVKSKFWYTVLWFVPLFGMFVLADFEAPKEKNIFISWKAFWWFIINWSNENAQIMYLVVLILWTFMSDPTPAKVFVLIIYAVIAGWCVNFWMPKQNKKAAQL